MCSRPIECWLNQKLFTERVQSLSATNCVTAGSDESFSPEMAYCTDAVAFGLVKANTVPSYVSSVSWIMIESMKRSSGRFATKNVVAGKSFRTRGELTRTPPGGKATTD